MHTRLNAGNFVKKESLEMKLSQREKSSFGINSEGESEKINFIQHQNRLVNTKSLNCPSKSEN